MHSAYAQINQNLPLQFNAYSSWFVIFSSLGRDVRRASYCRTPGVGIGIGVHKNFNLAFNSWTTILDRAFGKPRYGLQILDTWMGFPRLSLNVVLDSISLQTRISWSLGIQSKAESPIFLTLTLDWNIYFQSPFCMFRHIPIAFMTVNLQKKLVPMTTHGFIFVTFTEHWLFFMTFDPVVVYIYWYILL